MSDQPKKEPAKKAKSKQFIIGVTVNGHGRFAKGDDCPKELEKQVAKFIK